MIVFYLIGWMCLTLMFGLLVYSLIKEMDMRVRQIRLTQIQREFLAGALMAAAFLELLWIAIQMRSICGNVAIVVLYLLVGIIAWVQE